MDIYKLAAMSSDERKTILEGEAYSVEEQDYMRPLDEAELSTLKNDLAQAMVQKGFMDNEFDEIKADFKERLKPIQATIKTGVMCLTSRMRNERGKVYLIQDHENRMMHTVTSEGVVLNSRPLKPEERQIMIGQTKTA